MRLTKKQLKIIIENFLLEQEEEEINPEDLEVEEEPEGENADAEESGNTDEADEEVEEEVEEEPEAPFQEFETDEYPVSIGNKNLFVKVLDKGIDSIKVYSKETGDRIEGFKGLEISAIMFKTLVQVIQKGGDEEDKKNLINFFRYSQPKLESMSDEEIEKDLAKRERIWKISLSKLKDKFNRENYLK
jgi:hypothetical protein